MITKDIRFIMETLIDNGYECYIVGGAVRDHILGVEPKDIDFATNAHPDIVEYLFDKTIPTGKQYGTITVMLNDIPYEITTYRKDLEYKDGRRPEVVEFADILEEDLSRRDFTINAMAMDIDGNIIDPFNGKMDLNNRMIKCVGIAKERFNEDQLRILRAIRFVSRYDFIFYPDTELAMWNCDLTKLSIERIRDEFNKIIVSKNPSKWIKYMIRLGIIDIIIPELINCKDIAQNHPNHFKDVFGHIMLVLDNTEPKLELRLAALFHDIGKPLTKTTGEDGIDHFYTHHRESAKICREVMTRMKYSNKEIEYVAELVYHHMCRYEYKHKRSTRTVKRIINKVGVEKLDDLFKLQVADICGSRPPLDFEFVYRLKFECERVLNEKQPLSRNDLKVNGHDMISLGFSGQEIKSVLQYLLERVLEEPEWNVKDDLLALAKYFKSE